MRCGGGWFDSAGAGVYYAPMPISRHVLRRAREAFRRTGFGGLEIVSQHRLANRFELDRSTWRRYEGQGAKERERYAMIGLLVVEGLDPRAVRGLWPDGERSSLWPEY